MWYYSLLLIVSLIVYLVYFYLVTSGKARFIDPDYPNEDSRHYVFMFASSCCFFISLDQLKLTDFGVFINVVLSGAFFMLPAWIADKASKPKSQ